MGSTLPTVIGFFFSCFSRQPGVAPHEPQQPEPGPGAQPLLVPEQRAGAVRRVHRGRQQVEGDAPAGRHRRDNVGAQPVLPEHQGHVLPDAAPQPGPGARHARLRHRHTVLRAAVRLVSERRARTGS